MEKEVGKKLPEIKLLHEQNGSKAEEIHDRIPGNEFQDIHEHACNDDIPDDWSKRSSKRDGRVTIAIIHK